MEPYTMLQVEIISARDYAIERLKQEPSRELSLVVTKLEEALMWAEKGNR